MEAIKALPYVQSIHLFASSRYASDLVANIGMMHAVRKNQIFCISTAIWSLEISWIESRSATCRRCHVDPLAHKNSAETNEAISNFASVSTT
jgi:hypothetical protein